jgi:hypothetical protein
MVAAAAFLAQDPMVGRLCFEQETLSEKVI